MLFRALRSSEFLYCYFTATAVLLLLLHCNCDNSGHCYCYFTATARFTTATSLRLQVLLLLLHCSILHCAILLTLTKWFPIDITISLCFKKSLKWYCCNSSHDFCNHPNHSKAKPGLAKEAASLPSLYPIILEVIILVRHLIFYLKANNSQHVM